jgi:hypothetical protein
LKNPRIYEPRKKIVIWQVLIMVQIIENN